ncbi:hypothetical protein QWJ90_00145 [Microbacterium oryzae]|uniref:hypothetical protein n=1 Tax=Microbacterium oryzae TaxID=743009 RepID=UPI0025B104F7|nr:hypothetical protein [Microbacterium oryzae]MDN3309337.1 hypothetical protein [Microbacterium oryzae]
MNHDAPREEPEAAERASAVERQAFERLYAALQRLGGNTDWLVEGLTEALLRIPPVQKDGLSERQEQFLIEVGVFTADKLDEARSDVARGALQLSAARAFLTHISSMMSLDDVVAYLGWTEEAVRAAVREDRLYAVEIAGRLLFPSFQFTLLFGEKLLPGLSEIIKAAKRRWTWQDFSAFMSTPQEDLISRGRQTPTEYLRWGGPVDRVAQMIDESGWR